MKDPKLNALLDAAKELLVNSMDLGDVFVPDENEAIDYPVDENGDRWYHDWWNLKVAVEAYRQ